MNFDAINIKNTILLFAFVFPVYTWIWANSTKKRLKSRYDEEKMKHKKHNCVVIYNKELGIFGWPGFKGYYKFLLKETNKQLEPVCYFITTATKSLDIAMMMINSDVIVNALISVLKRGVKVRLLLDYDAMFPNSVERKLHHHGAEILYFILPKEKGDSILHYKYSVKDYSKEGGFLYCGSINWNLTAFLNNYEDMMFTTNKSVVDAFHNNFTEAWDYVTNLCATNFFVKAKLAQIKL